MTPVVTVNNRAQTPAVNSGGRSYYTIENNDKQKILSDESASTDTERARKAELLKAARGFEAIFLRQFMKSMRDTLSGEGMFGKGSVGEIYGDMMDNAVAEVASKRGSLGIADMIYRQLVHDMERRTVATPQENI